ncbi:hypothetical protein SAMN04489864_11031 [Pedobacter insulae]|uniref:Uncharacterized protein n=1 Tax=Pedobacter insulae TaxID=414048 RepID=A0A1I2ZHA4_9SPHI|nr:hypothetical protein SAMN04489864_11031 [Pedobacter insulae]
MNTNYEKKIKEHQKGKLIMAVIIVVIAVLIAAIKYLFTRGNF